MVNEDSEFNERLRAAIALTRGSIAASKPVTRSKKADALLIISPSGEVRGCSIKEAEANFNQLERVWLEALAEDLKMPDSIRNRIQTCIDNRRLKKSVKFITEDHQEEIISYFQDNIDNLLRRLFTGYDDTLAYFVIYDYTKRSWHICLIADVINAIREEEITVSDKGVLYFGCGLSMQKKGGNGAHVKVPKSHPTHPGNQLQFKIKPISLLHMIPNMTEI